MITLDYLPDGLQEIKEYYGDPDQNDDYILDDSWYSEQTMVLILPFKLRLSWNPEKEISRIRAHRKVGGALIDAIAEIGWLYRERLQKENLDLYGGTFNFRKMRGRNYLSTHSWGIAIDYCPHIGRLGSQEDANEYPKLIVEAFKQRGFVWGGDWARPDPMHFQACRGY